MNEEELREFDDLSLLKWEGKILDVLEIGAGEGGRNGRE